MNYSTKEMEDFALPLPITQTARKTAQQFASQQPTPQKAEQVRLNTLAVCVVNDYLQMMGIACDLSKSDSWNRVVRMCADIADLHVPGVGCLECRPLLPRSQTCYIPPEVSSDRIGYVVVEIDESLRQATVLGFAPQAAHEHLALSQLRPLENLLDRLSELMQPQAQVVSHASRQTWVNLSQWLVNAFDAGWQTVEELLNPAQTSLAFSFRGVNMLEETTSRSPNVSIRRAKLIELGTQLDDSPVAVIVELTPQLQHKTDILLQVHPIGGQTYLPQLLELTVLDESGATFLEAQARNADNYIQLEFSGSSGERFSVKVANGDTSITENFVI